MQKKERLSIKQVRKLAQQIADKYITTPPYTKVTWKVDLPSGGYAVHSYSVRVKLYYEYEELYSKYPQWIRNMDDELKLAMERHPKIVRTVVGGILRVTRNGKLIKEKRVQG